MTKLEKLLVATVEAEIEDRGEPPVIVNIELVRDLHAQQYSIQQITDCVILDHYKHAIGVHQIANQVYDLLVSENDTTRKIMYQYLDIERLSYRHLNDETFKTRIQVLNEVYEFALDVWEEERFVWEWLKSDIPSLGYRKPIEILKEENGRELVMQCLNCIKYGVYA